MKKAILGLLALIALVVTCGIGISGSSKGTPIKVPTTASRDIRLSVTGTTRASMTYNNGINQAQENSTTAPWVRDYTTNSSMTVVLLAQNQAPGGGSTITCSIYVNGKLNVTNTSTGPYAVVTCTES